MKKQWGSVELLRHCRHDWLNHMQLIKANLSLNRVKRANEIIDEITMQSQHESKLTNLNIPVVSEMLLTFNWLEHPYKIEVEIFGRERDLSEYEKNLHDFFTHWFEQLDAHSNREHENSVQVTFQLKEQGAFISLEFTGVLNQNESLYEKPQLHNQLSIIEQYTSEEAFGITLKLS